MQPVSDELLGKIDLITPNEVEQIHRHQGGQRGSGGQGSGLFFSKSKECIDYTAWGSEAYINTGEKRALFRLTPAYKVEAVTPPEQEMHLTAAFGGAAEERIRAADFANALAALSVQKIGTTPSMPVRERLTHLWLQIVRLRIADAQTLNIGIVKAQSKLRNQRNYRQNTVKESQSNGPRSCQNHSQMDHSQMDHGQRNHGQESRQGAADKRAASQKRHRQKHRPSSGK